MNLPSTLLLLYNAFCDHVRSAFIAKITVGLATVWALRTAIQATGKKPRTTKLRGPKSNNLLFGVSKELFESTDMGGMFEAWSKEYGVVYEIPMIYGEKRIALCDPRAVAHLLSKDTWAYIGVKGMKEAIARRAGKGLLYGEGESHRRQRRTMGPSLNPTAIRKLTPAVHKAIDKMKAAWEASIEASGGDSVVLNVQKWMSYVSLDSFGIAVLDSFAEGVPDSAFSIAVTVLSLFFPIAMHIPTHRNQMFDRLHGRMTELCDALIDNADANRDVGEHVSTINSLLRAEDEDSGQRISREEVLSQLRTMLIASYESTSVAMTWALLELAQHPNIQTKLREELSSVGREPSYDQLTNDLPYLDAVVQETLRLHPSVPELLREAAADDVIPLSEPVQTKSGEFVDSIVVGRGTTFTLPISCINRSEAIWGPDAKVFRPERWLEPDGITKKAQEVKGHRHLLSFGDGARTCIGKTFALAVIKAELSMAIRNFVLEMKDGPDTKVELGRGIRLRPKIVGEEGIKVPLRIRCYKG